MDRVTPASVMAADPDAELIRLCSELSQCAAEIDYINATPSVHDAVQARCERAVEPVIDTPARSPEGIRAKALALKASLDRHVRNGPGVAFTDNADEEEMLAWSLVHDILGEEPEWAPGWAGHDPLVARVRGSDAGQAAQVPPQVAARQPPYRFQRPHAAVRAAIAKAGERNLPEDGA